MKLTKEQIKLLEKAHRNAIILENKLSGAEGILALLIEEMTGVEGYCDYLSGDGFGFTPVSNNETHIPFGDLIQLAKNGEDITEDLILQNLSI